MTHLYRDIAIRLRWEIKEEGWQPGQKLPTLNELAARFGCARPTVRRALDLLAEEKVITVKPSKGIFIAGDRLLSTKEGIVDTALRQLAAQGHPIPAAEELAVRYGVSPTTVRRVVQPLIAEGVLVRKTRGAGYAAA
jgi:DNA-binding GntR family transcriptional regulator